MDFGQSDNQCVPATNACEQRIIMLTPAATDRPAMPYAVARHCRKLASETIGSVVARRMENGRRCYIHRAFRDAS